MGYYVFWHVSANLDSSNGLAFVLIFFVFGLSPNMLCFGFDKPGPSCFNTIMIPLCDQEVSCFQFSISAGNTVFGLGREFLNVTGWI